MSEADFCYDEGQWLADKAQYEREHKEDSLLKSYEKRIENQREEIRRLNNHIRNLEQSRNNWKEKAERLGNQLYEELERRKG